MLLPDHGDGCRRRQMRDQETPNRRKLNLGIDAIGTVDTILSWNKLEICFGNSFKFSTEAKFEITRELAVQQGRLQRLKSEKKSNKMFDFQEDAKNMAEKIESLIESNDSRSLSFVSDIVKRETGSEIKAFCDALRALASTDNVFETIRPNDLFRDIIRKIVKILLFQSG